MKAERTHEIQQISAPPAQQSFAEEAGVEDPEQYLAPLFDWRAYSELAAEKKVEAVFDFPPGITPGEIRGRVNLVVGAQRGEVSVLTGAIHSYENFCSVRKSLIDILNVPIPMRVGCFEFLVDESETNNEASETGNCYEVMYLTAENLLGIGIEVYQVVDERLKQIKAHAQNADIAT